MVRLLCEICGEWHSDSGSDQVVGCYICDHLLCPVIDYSCPNCIRSSCDRCNQACQEEDCDTVTCHGCVDRHLESCHPMAYVHLSLDLPICG